MVMCPAVVMDKTSQVGLIFCPEFARLGRRIRKADVCMYLVAVNAARATFFWCRAVSCNKAQVNHEEPLTLGCRFIVLTYEDSLIYTLKRRSR